jgi:hypothetical protein
MEEPPWAAEVVVVRLEEEAAEARLVVVVVVAEDQEEKQVEGHDVHKDFTKKHGQLAEKRPEREERKTRLTKCGHIHWCQKDSLDLLCQRASLSEHLGHLQKREKKKKKEDLASLSAQTEEEQTSLVDKECRRQGRTPRKKSSPRSFATRRKKRRRRRRRKKTTHATTDGLSLHALFSPRTSESMRKKECGQQPGARRERGEKCRDRRNATSFVDDDDQEEIQPSSLSLTAIRALPKQSSIAGN